MNTTKIVKKEKINQEYRNGDIFASVADEKYMLAIVETKYVAICLGDGCFWTTQSFSAENAVEGLNYLGSNATIEISF
jgi:hypothetical protein